MLRIPLFDCHCDTIHSLVTGDQFNTLRKNKLHVDLVRGSNYEPWVQVFALFASGPDAAMMYLQMLDRFFLEMDRNRDIITQCRNSDEARDIAQSGKIAAFLSVEGAEQLGCSTEGLEKAADIGVKAVNLTWNHANQLSGSNLEDTQIGLSQDGIGFLKRCNALGVLVDVSYLSDAGFWDVVKYSNGPFIARHSNLRSLCPHPRNLTDEMFQALCDHGGVAGVNFCPEFLGEDAGMEDIVRHIEHFLDLGGEKHLGIGADLDGIGHTPHGIHGIQDTGNPYLRLLELGYNETLLRDLFFENFMRVFE